MSNRFQYRLCNVRLKYGGRPTISTHCISIWLPRGCFCSRGHQRMHRKIIWRHWLLSWWGGSGYCVQQCILHSSLKQHWCHLDQHSADTVCILFLLIIVGEPIVWLENSLGHPRSTANWQEELLLPLCATTWWWRQNVEESHCSNICSHPCPSHTLTQWQFNTRVKKTGAPTMGQDRDHGQLLNPQFL